MQTAFYEEMPQKSSAYPFAAHSIYLTSKTWFYKLPAARFSPKKLIFLIKSFENFQKKPSKIFKNVQKMSKIFEKWGEILIVKKILNF